MRDEIEIENWQFYEEIRREKARRREREKKEEKGVLLIFLALYTQLDRSGEPDMRQIILVCLVIW